jgi:hypothetical protein
MANIVLLPHWMQFENPSWILLHLSHLNFMVSLLIDWVLKHLSRTIRDDGPQKSWTAAAVKDLFFVQEA